MNTKINQIESFSLEAIAETKLFIKKLKTDAKLFKIYNEAIDTYIKERANAKTIKAKINALKYIQCAIKNLLTDEKFYGSANFSSLLYVQNEQRKILTNTQQHIANKFIKKLLNDSQLFKAFQGIIAKKIESISNLKVFLKQHKVDCTPDEIINAFALYKKDNISIYTGYYSDITLETIDGTAILKEQIKLPLLIQFDGSIHLGWTLISNFTYEKSTLAWTGDGDTIGNLQFNTKAILGKDKNSSAQVNYFSGTLTITSNKLEGFPPKGTYNYFGQIKMIEKNGVFVPAKPKLEDKKAISSIKHKKTEITLLSNLLKEFGGGVWPSDWNDISISHVSVISSSMELSIKVRIDLVTNAKNNNKMKHLHSLLGKNYLLFDFVATSVGVFNLSCQLAKPIKLFGKGNSSLILSTPTVSISINTLFKFNIFKISGKLKFSLFGKEIDALVTITIDNIQADVAVMITGDNSSFPSPPILKGLHIDQFGIEMGVFFDPMGFDFGIEGIFHVGSEPKEKVKKSTKFARENNTFGLVCNFPEEIPVPVYISYYLDKIDLNTVIELFTNLKENIPFPVSLHDYSLYFAKEPISLPDGTLSPMGIGYSAMWKILDFEYYGKFEFNVNKVLGSLSNGKITGLFGVAEIAPINLGIILKITGDGKGVTQAFNSKGVAIGDIQVANPLGGTPISGKRLKSKTNSKTISKYTIKQLVSPGGPILEFNLSSSPYFTFNAKISLFGLVNEKIDATIGKDGISFELDFKEIIESKMKCVLNDYHNFSGNFSYRIKLNIDLGIFGTINLDTSCNISLSISTSDSDIDFSIKGNFEFDGETLSFGPYSGDIHITKISDLLLSIEHYIVKYAKDIFADFIKDPERWVDAVKKGLITAEKDVVKGLKTVFHKTDEEAVSILHSIGYGIHDIIHFFDSIFSSDSKPTHALSCSKLISALSTGFKISSKDVVAALKIRDNVKGEKFINITNHSQYEEIVVVNLTSAIWDNSQKVWVAGKTHIAKFHVKSGEHISKSIQYKSFGIGNSCAIVYMVNVTGMTNWIYQMKDNNPYAVPDKHSVNSNNTINIHSNKYNEYTAFFSNS